MSFSDREDPEHSLRRHRALAGPSRARILAALADEGPLDVRQLANRFSLHVNTVRVHLNGLAEVNLVERETLPPHGRGRPRVVYRASAVAAGEESGRRYRLLAEILTAVVARFGAETAAQLEETGEVWGRYLVESPPPYAIPIDDEVISRLMDLLAEIGFQPRLEEGGGERQVLMRPCPFLEVARSHQNVICPIHLGLMRGALAELGAKMQTTKLEPFVRPDLCVAHLERVSAA